MCKQDARMCTADLADWRIQQLAGQLLRCAAVCDKQGIWYCLRQQQLQEQHRQWQQRACLE
jgi:hypothetical protein